MGKEKGLAKAAVVIMAATLIGRFVGFIREMVIANQFGATLQTDAYNIAYTIPSLVAMALAGAFNAAFLPVFNDYLVNKDRREAQQVANTVINLIILFFVVVIAVAFVLGPNIVRMLAPGLGSTGQELADKLFRIILPSLLFVGLMGLVSAVLNSFKHFLSPAMGPMVTSCIAIGFMLVFGSRWGIYSLAIGTLLGFGVQFLVQLPVMWRKGYQYRLTLNLGHPGVKRVLTLMVPVLLGVMVSQLPVFVERNLASNLDVGSISALNYANRVMQLPLGLFVTAISIPIFPALSVHASKKEHEEFKETLVRGINLFFIILIPCAVGLAVFSSPIIKLLFEHGRFSAESTRVTAYALTFYTLTIVPWALKDILTRGFYALQNTLSPVVITGIGAISMAVFDFALVKVMGVGGLALGYGLGMWVTAIILYLFLSRRVGDLGTRNWIKVLGKVAVASVVMALIGHFGLGWMNTVVPMASKKLLVIKLAGVGAVALAAYLLMLILLKVEEVWELFKMIKGMRQKLLKRA